MFQRKFKDNNKKFPKRLALLYCVLGFVGVVSLVWFIKFMQLVVLAPPSPVPQQVKSLAPPVEIAAKKISDKLLKIQKHAGEGGIAAPPPVVPKKEPEDKKLPPQGFPETSVEFFEDMECSGKSYAVKSTDEVVHALPGCGAEGCFDIKCSDTAPDPMLATAKSMRITGGGELDFYWTCKKENGDYWASLNELDGCSNIYAWPKWGHARFVKASLNQSIPSAEYDPKPDKSTPAKYNIAYSVESSTYFAYQVYASLWAFGESKQDDASYTRLLTCQEPDDLADHIPTFTAKRHPFSKRYGPFNKPDVVTKWFASSNAPTEDVIVVIDPDNWLTENLRPWVDQVKPGYGVAQSAFYAGSTATVKKMYDMVCKDILQDGHCDNELALSAVPYMLHREDWKTVAPLWKMYSLILKEMVENDNNIKMMFMGVQVDWCAEMFAFNFACAHMGIKVKLEHNLQIRDVGTRPKSSVKNIPMIHMGRAWFPRGSEAAKQWIHTEGKAFASHGDQVWCKCNDTANDVQPWPIPDSLDYVSDWTLRCLHESRETYGKPPENKYRTGAYHDGHA